MFAEGWVSWGILLQFFRKGIFKQNVKNINHLIILTSEKCKLNHKSK